MPRARTSSSRRPWNNPHPTHDRRDRPGNTRARSLRPFFGRSPHHDAPTDPGIVPERTAGSVRRSRTIAQPHNRNRPEFSRFEHAAQFTPPRLAPRPGRSTVPTRSAVAPTRRISAACHSIFPPVPHGHSADRAPNAASSFPANQPRHRPARFRYPSDMDRS